MPETCLLLCQALKPAPSLLRINWVTAAAALLVCAAPLVSSAAVNSDTAVLDARDAFRVKDRSRLASSRAALIAAKHPLAMWAEYWELSAKLTQASADEVDAFFARWRGSYVEDRMRNDWILELGRRRDWPRIIQNWPHYRMRDDREAACFMWLARFSQGEDVTSDARQAWQDQRDADDGCALLGQALNSAQRLPAPLVWRKLRSAVENNQYRYARQTAGLLSKDIATSMTEVMDAPTRLLKRQRRSMGANALNVAALALVRQASSDPEVAASQLKEHWQSLLPKEVAAWAWAGIARQSAFKLAPQASDYYERAWEAYDAAEHPGIDSSLRFDNPSDRPVQAPARSPGWSDETLAWQVRAALRVATAERSDPALAARRWRQVIQAIDAMSPAARADASWVYWKARAWLALPAERLPAASLPDGLLPAGATPVKAQDLSSGQILAIRASGAAASAPGSAAEARADTPAPRPAEAVTSHTVARALLNTIRGPHSFYALLAAEELGQAETPPAKPKAPTTEERSAARANPGLARAMLLFKLGLRSDAVREWNYTTGFGRIESDGEAAIGAKPMADRQLLAAAQWACEQEIWDRCIQAADRTREEIDLGLRFPTPFRKEVVESAKAVKMDAAYVFGLIRQESRFILAARSNVGASGLMQLMPATAKWTAHKLGVAYSPEAIHEPQANIKLGVGYLKLALNNFGGSQALAAAAYNAGPSRPRRWREGATIDAAAWAEGIPFAETRDYVKKVLANAWSYQAVLAGKTTPLRARLGLRIGPNEPSSATPDPDLP